MSLVRFPILRGLLEDLTKLNTQEVSRRAAVAHQVRESRDVTTVSIPWVGEFHLTGPQRAVVRELIDSLVNCSNPCVEERVLLLRSKSQARSLEELFKGSPAWGVLILRGAAPGTFQIAPPPDGEPVEEEVVREPVEE